jgi:hypothetical protein
MKIRSDDKIIINKQLITKDVEGIVYILDPRNGTIHTLNETASFIWRCLKTSQTLNQLTEKLVEHFQIDNNHARTDLKEFIEKYLEQSLVVISNKK